jgi:hypothetical protein
MGQPFRHLAMLAASCAAAAGAAAAPPHSSWKRVTLSEGTWSGPSYSIALPPGVEGGPGQGIDSDVAYLRGEGLHMTFDYGPYGSYSGCRAAAGCVEHDETIDGRPARIAIGTARISARIEVGPPTVDLFAECTTPAACARVVDMLRTIRFGR